ncbi:MAG TPA: hypothetical protein VFY01_08000, partial [Rheinheimera sp.]|nr:hypothetical protein [Rheinheimera sp.]
MINKTFRISSVMGFSIFYSSCLIVLFGAVLSLTGWLLHHDARIDRFIMLPDTTFAFIAAVVMLSGLVSHNRAVVLQGNLMIVFVALAGLLWHQPDATASPISWQSAQARVPLLQSLALLLFCLTSLGWFSRRNSARWQPFFVLRLLCNLLLAGFSISVLLSQHELLPTMTLSLSTAASVNTALYLLLLAVASFSAPYVKTRSSTPQLPHSGWLLVSFMALATTLLWFNFAHQLQHKVEQVSTQIADKLQQNVALMIS